MPSVAPETSPGPIQAPPSTLKTLNPNKRSLSDVEEDIRDSKKPKRPEDPERVSELKDKKKRRKKKRKVPVVIAGTAVTVKGTTASPIASGSRLLLTLGEMKPADPLVESSNDSSDPKSDSSTISALTTPEEGDESKITPSELQRASDKGKCKATDDVPAIPLPGPSSESPEAQIARLTRQLADQTEAIVEHESVLSQLQQSLACQICLELMYKPYALAPCGHLACYQCLVQWFKAPPANELPLPTQLRKKTCPHCRSLVKERPVEVWGVKSMVGTLAKSSLLPNVNPPVESAQNENAQSADPWDGIFFKPNGGRVPRYRFREADDVLPAPLRGGPEPIDDLGEAGMYDAEDGVFRCVGCMHEIWDGICSSCGRVYRRADSLGELDAGEEFDEVEAREWWADVNAYHALGVRVPDGSDEEESDDDLDLDALDPELVRLHPRERVGLVQLRPDEIDEIEDDDDEGEEEGEGDWEDEYDGNDSFIDDEDEGVPRHVRLPGDHSIIDPASESGSEHAGPPLPHQRLVNTRAAVVLSDDEESDGAIEIVHHRRRPAPGASHRRGATTSIVVISSEEESGDEEPDVRSTAATAGSRNGRPLVHSSGDDEASDGESSHLENHSDFEGEHSGSDGEPDPNLALLVAQRELEQYGEDDSVPYVPLRRLIAEPRSEDTFDVSASEDEAYNSPFDDECQNDDRDMEPSVHDDDEESQDGYESG